MNRRTGSGRTITVKQFTVKQFSGRLKTVKEREGQCQDDLWLRVIRTLIFYVQFQVFDSQL